MSQHFKYIGEEYLYLYMVARQNVIKNITESETPIFATVGYLLADSAWRLSKSASLSDNFCFFSRTFRSKT